MTEAPGTAACTAFAPINVSRTRRGSAAVFSIIEGTNTMRARFGARISTSSMRPAICSGAVSREMIGASTRKVRSFAAVNPKLEAAIKAQKSLVKVLEPRRPVSASAMAADAISAAASDEGSVPKAK